MKNKKIVRLKPLVPPRAVEKTYAKELLTMVGEMAKEYREILAIYKDKRGQIVGDSPTWLTTDVQNRLSKLGKKWQKRFAEYAQAKAPALVRKLLRMTDTQLKSVLKDYLAENQYTLVGEYVPTPLKQVMKAHVAENVALIKSIPFQYADRIEGAVYRAITGAGTLKDLTAELRKDGNITVRRAKLIAGDQTRKIFTTMAVKRMESVGIRKFEWVHTIGDPHYHYRPYHKRRWDGVSGLKDGHPNGLNGFIFDMNHLPVIEERTGQRGLPNQLPFCRCHMRPIITFD